MKITRLAWFLLGLLLTLSGAGLASGVSGFPFNPVFGAITAASESLTGASSAATYLASSATLPQIGIANGGSNLNLNVQAGVSTINAPNAALTVAAGGTNCLKLGSASGTESFLLPCTSATGTGNFIPTLNAAQTTKSGQFYSFNITNNGTTCATAANSPAFPTGWSAVRTSAGLCTFTFPAITNAPSMIVQAMAVATTEFCTLPANSTTTVAIKCFTTAGTATDTGFMVYFEDWN